MTALKQFFKNEIQMWGGGGGGKEPKNFVHEIYVNRIIVVDSEMFSQLFALHKSNSTSPASPCPELN